MFVNISDRKSIGNLVLRVLYVPGNEVGSRATFDTICYPSCTLLTKVTWRNTFFYFPHHHLMRKNCKSSHFSNIFTSSSHFRRTFVALFSRSLASAEKKLTNNEKHAKSSDEMAKTVKIEKPADIREEINQQTTTSKS